MKLLAGIPGTWWPETVGWISELWCRSWRNGCGGMGGGILCSEKNTPEICEAHKNQQTWSCKIMKPKEVSWHNNQPYNNQQASADPSLPWRASAWAWAKLGHITAAMPKPVSTVRIVGYGMRLDRTFHHTTYQTYQFRRSANSSANPETLQFDRDAWRFFFSFELALLSETPGLDRPQKFGIPNPNGFVWK